MSSSAHFGPLREVEELSLSRGGPFFRLLGRLRLVPRANQLGVRLVIWTMCLTWLPVVLLLLVQHLQTGVSDPLLTGTELHARMLFSLSLLLVGEWVFEARARSVNRHLLDHDFIPDHQEAHWRATLYNVLEVRDSWAPEAALLVMVYAISMAGYLGHLSPEVLRWLAPTIHEVGKHGSQATPAMWWYLMISQPMFLFVLLRWISRWLLFAQLMWSLARLPPRIEGLHADRFGGLGFLTAPLVGFRFASMAMSIALMSVWLDELARSKAKPAIFAKDMLGFVAMSMLLAILPYLPFTRVLMEAKHRALLSCSALMERYTTRFEERWYRDGPRRDADKLLGNEDFSGLADLGTSFSVLEEMHTSLPGPRQLKAHLIAALGPFLLIVLLYGPPAADLAEALVKRLLGG